MQLTHLQQTVHDLDDVVLEQHKQIDVLRRRIERLSAELSNLCEPDTEPRKAEDEKPPHY